MTKPITIGRIALVLLLAGGLLTTTGVAAAETVADAGMDETGTVTFATPSPNDIVVVSLDGVGTDPVLLSLDGKGNDVCPCEAL